ncbi:MAG: hypothetical protein V1857_07240 [archaeon]
MSVGKLRVKRRGIALELRRPAISEDKLVYVVIANRPFKYGKLSSRIAYIGTTKNGVYRIAASAAKRAQLLRGHGIQGLTFHVLCCDGRQRMCTWKVLEAGLLGSFIEKYGGLPKGNRNKPSGGNLRRAHEKFNWPLLQRRIEEFS